jgi:rod shape determining protein RodA
MRKRTSSGLEKTDRLTFSIYLALVAIGWTMVLSVGYEPDIWQRFFSAPIGKQTIWIGISLATFFAVFGIQSRFWMRAAYPIYGLAVSLLIAVLLVGTTIKGSKSWFALGGVSFQPSELAKFGTALAMAAYLSRFKTKVSVPGDALLALAILGIPMLLILLQPDAGSALVFLAFLLVLYRSGLNPAWYAFGFFTLGALLAGLIWENTPLIASVLLFAGILLLAYQQARRRQALWATGIMGAGGAAIYWVAPQYLNEILLATGVLFGLLALLMYRQNKLRLGLLVALVAGWGIGVAALSQYLFNQVLKPHQQDRINVWLHPERCSEQGSLYNLLQSQTAIGSGGLTGKGIFEGIMTKLKHVPEQSTDFIFCTVGEEHGFIGSTIVICLYLLLLIRITILAERQRAAFSRYYAYGIAGILFIHFFINIGMTMGLVPIIGIPLPFLSKGGSSLLGFTIMLAVLLKLDSKRLQLA